jgi:hypothetical protein
MEERERLECIMQEMDEKQILKCGVSSTNLTRGLKERNNMPRQMLN